MLAALALALQAPQADAARPATSASQSDVIVRAGQEAESARYVEALTQTIRGGQIARWHKSLCPEVIGLDDRHAAQIAARIAEVGASVGLRRPATGCAPFVLIIASQDADALMAALVRRHPGLFRDPKYGIAHGAEISRLLTPRPVRWLASSRTVDYTGMEMSDGVIPGGAGVVNPRLGSRITLPTREDVLMSVLLVNVDKLQSLRWPQLADYLAMAALAQPKLDGQFDDDTILSLFAARGRGQPGPSGLTPRDRALLAALYHTDPAVSAPAERARLISRVQRARSSL